MFSKESFPENLNSCWKEYLAAIANHSLSKKSWSAYTTAGNLLIKCQNETNTSMALPLDDEKVLTYVAWLFSRGLQSRTISTYLAGLRQIHLAQGILIPVLRPEIVKQLLTGASNLERIKSRLNLKVSRLPVTITLMKLLKIGIKRAKTRKR